MSKLDKIRASIVGVVVALFCTPALAVPVTVSITQLNQITPGSQTAADGSFTQISPTPTDYAINTQFKFFVPPAFLGTATGLLDSLIGTPNNGCDAGDYAGFTAGNIALFGDDTCTYAQQVAAAFVAGAIGAIARTDDISSPFGLAGPVSIPTIVVLDGLSDSLNDQLNADSQQVPEPGTLVLFGLGLAGVGLARRKRSA